ncbi:MAG TPA: acyl-CoA dehydrogenase family protein [Cerasibacillus sp.]|uniref:acyl-CoA dehydrogenase family protein n=1 Tax=Cerasibacillus sp. TaxID=2498711 RepID=UPI002F3F95F8
MSQLKDLVPGCSFLVDDIEHIVTPEDFTDEHQMIARTTEEFLDKEILPKMEHLENQEIEYTVDLLKQAGELGLLSADIPEAYGGLALDAVSSALITEKLSVAGGFSVSHSGHVGIGSLPIIYFGNEDQKKKYLPKLATGELLAAYALTEPASGSDALGARATAKLNDAGTHYILNGEKQFITNAGFADVFIVYAKIDGKHFSAFIVERDFPGVSTGPEEKKMGLKSSSTRTLILEDAEVPVDNLLGEKGRGHIIAFNILNVGRSKLAISSVGATKRALELATTYTNEREQFNQPLSRFTLTQNKLATIATELYAHESAVYRTVGLYDQRIGSLSIEQLKDGREVANAIAAYQVECSINKYTCTELLDRSVDEALQLHGGYGFVQEYEIERMYRDSRVNRIFEGTNEINRILVPRQLLKLAASGQLSLFANIEQSQKELLSPYQVKDEHVLAKEKVVLNKAKHLFLYVIHHLNENYQEKLEFEQELLVNLADIVAHIYNMESAILRTEKAIQATGKEKSALKRLYTEVYVQETIEKIVTDAKHSLLATEENNSQQDIRAALDEFIRQVTINIIPKKREIARKVIEEEKYVV